MDKDMEDKALDQPWCVKTLAISTSSALSGRGYRHRTNYDSFTNNGQNNGGFIPQQPINSGGFDPQANNNNNNNFQGSSSSWGNIPNSNTQFDKTPNTQLGQLEVAHQSPPQVEVQPGTSSSPPPHPPPPNNHPSEAANADIDTTGARTFGKSSSSDVAVAEDTVAPPTDAVPTLPPTDRSLAVDLPQGAGSNSGQSGAQSSPTSAVDPNSSKLIPEPPVLG
uniref:Uncharacterized protein n=1 Tax=Ditylenchus dipsaci TaxID=166011 RepID=A0A915ER49_9BILA